MPKNELVLPQRHAANGNASASGKESPGFKSRQGAMIFGKNVQVDRHVSLTLAALLFDASEAAETEAAVALPFGMTVISFGSLRLANFEAADCGAICPGFFALALQTFSFENFNFFLYIL
jgi:hypothetical protein